LVASLINFATRQFLERIVTADETWLHHYEPESHKCGAKLVKDATKKPFSDGT
jgi:hypothetical protein